MTEEYRTDRQNTVKQLREKARYDKDTVHRILDAGLVAHVTFGGADRPVVVPMIYGRENDVVFLHGARKARVIRMLENAREACLNVTLVDGIVLARSAFNSSMNYRSVTVFGTPRLIESRDDKLHAMRIISEHLMPGRWDELRAPHEREIKMTGVIGLEISTASAKVSAGSPSDEDDDYEIPIWAGVLPLEAELGEPVADERLLTGVTPSDVVRKLKGRRF